MLPTFEKENSSSLLISEIITGVHSGLLHNTIYFTKKKSVESAGII